MPDQNDILTFFGSPPYYRVISTGKIVNTLPYRVRLPDGSTRTDPEQWANDPEILLLAGYEITEITQEDIDQKKALLESMLPVVTFEELQSAKLLQLDSYYNDLFQTGWQTPEGWYLAASVDDVSLLTGAFVLLKEGVALSLTETIDVIDTDQNVHSLDLATMTQLMLGYGQFRSGLSDQYAAIKKQILNATNEQELDIINIGE